MDPTTDSGQLAQALDSLQAHLLEAQAYAPDAQASAEIALLGKELAQTQAGFWTEYRQALAEAEQKQRDAQEQARVLEAALTRLEESASAAAAPPALPPVPPPAKTNLDPGLGLALRNDLLERFGLPRKAPVPSGGLPVPAAQPNRSAFDTWNAEDLKHFLASGVSRQEPRPSPA